MYVGIPYYVSGFIQRKTALTYSRCKTQLIFIIQQVQKHCGSVIMQGVDFIIRKGKDYLEGIGRSSAFD